MVTKQSDPVRAGLRIIWHLSQGGEEVRMQAEKLWCEPGAWESVDY